MRSGIEPELAGDDIADRVRLVHSLHADRLQAIGRAVVLEIARVDLNCKLAVSIGCGGADEWSTLRNIAVGIVGRLISREVVKVDRHHITEGRLLGKTFKDRCGDVRDLVRHGDHVVSNESAQRIFDEAGVRSTGSVRV